MLRYPMLMYCIHYPYTDGKGSIVSPLFASLLVDICQYTPLGTESILDSVVSVDHIIHSFIIIREVLILTLSIFIAL